MSREEYQQKIRELEQQVEAARREIRQLEHDLAGAEWKATLATELLEAMRQQVAS